MPAQVLRRMIRTLEKRKQAGWMCDFEAGDILDRVDPARSLPGVRSVIAAAFPYRTAAWETPRPPGLRGVLSKYAWGEDYHRVLRARLEKLAALLTHAAGRPVSWRAAVDIGPLVERAFAEAAGLGWIGKNGCLFVEPHGSWVFLGLLLTDLRVEPGPAPGEESVEIGGGGDGAPIDGPGGERPIPIPAGDPEPEALFSRCGSCDKCLQACPTQAFVAPGALNANRCLSYVTQMKGILPKEFRRKMGTRIWGCDICQAVCPVNRGAEPAPEPAADFDSEVAFPDLIRLLTLSQRAFRRRFGSTAAAWRGVHVIRRNAAVALGNRRDARAVPHLVPLLNDPRPEIRAAAAWALGEIGGQTALAALAEAAAREEEPRVRADMQTILLAKGMAVKPF